MDGKDEVWGVNDLCLRRPVDVVFDIHKDFFLHTQLATINYVNEKRIPMITHKEEKHIPTSIRFPMEEMHCEYFTSSIAYMIAYAIHEGATIIDMYGILMGGNQSEYFVQKPCCEYWIGYARGKGIEVNLPKFTYLLKYDEIYM